MKFVQYDVYHFQTQLTVCVLCHWAILGDKTAMKIEMFHHRIKVITQINFVLICRETLLLLDKRNKTMPAKHPHSMTVSFSVGVQVSGFSFDLSSIDLKCPEVQNVRD